jgi:site-specific DNA-methyltransferase (adenine-specific)/modification methylase
MEINKLYNESCIDTLNRMPNNFIDLVVTSPPYNMRTRIRNGQYTKREKAEHFSKKYNYFNDDLTIDEFYDFHKKVLNELIRVSKVICYNFQIVTGSKEAFFKLIGDFNTYIKDIIIWDKGFGQPAMHENVLNSCFEIILIMESNNDKGRVITNSYFKRGTRDNIIRTRNKKKSIDTHSAVFPELMVGELIKSFSKEGDLVYDPFMGSGTTGAVAHKLNRNWLGSEISIEYCKISNTRISSSFNLFSTNY